MWKMQNTTVVLHVGKKPFSTTSFMFQLGVNCFEQQKGKESKFGQKPITCTEMYM